MIEQAYDLKNIVYTTGGQTISANGAGETIAIVDAFGDPDISNDLQTFDANFGIGNDNASGQFVLTVATPEGSVRTNAGWDTEQSLDVEWAHAIAPEANILLVEANSASTTALTNAVVWAEQQTGVVAVSMSFGSTPEFAGETAFDPDFTTPSGHAGVTFVASSGDNAMPNYPSTSPNVLAVGGTTLDVDASGNYISESPWSDGGGGVSPFEHTTKPDVAYDANPSTGFLIYDSIPSDGVSGWQVVGGTSAGAPQWTAIVALVDQGRSLRSLGSLDGPTQTIPDLYSLPTSDFNDVPGGGFTGLGSPIGEKIISSLVGGGITSVSSSSNSSPSASRLVFAQQPGNVTAGNKINPSVTVDIEDSDGDVVTSDNSSVTISIAGGPGTLGGTLTVTAVNGVATFSNLSLKTAGSYTLKVVDGSLVGTTSSSFSVAAAAASQLIFVQQPSSATAGRVISPAVAVELEDQFGNVASTDTSDVTLAVATGLSSLSGTTTVAAVNGVATFKNLSITTSGTYTLNATDGSLTRAISSSFAVSAAAASKIVFTQQPSSVIAGAIAPLVIVAVEDQFDNIVTSDSSSVTLAVNSGPGLLGGIVTVQVADGTATFSDLSLTTAGSYTLAATDDNFTTAISSSFNVTPAAASQLIFAQQPSDATAGSTISPAVIVAVEDQFDNVVTSDSSSVTLTVNAGPGSLGGIVSVQAVNGVATFNNLSLNTAGSYALGATDDNFITATSSSFNITPAAASQLAFVQQPGNVTSGSTIRPAVTVAVEDQFGNVATNDSSSVTISVATGPSSKAKGTLTEQAVNGIATFSDLSLDTRGSYTLQATDGLLTAAASNDFAIGVGAIAAVSNPVTHLIFMQQPSNAIAGNAINPSIVVELEDRSKNIATSDDSDVTLSISSGPVGASIGGIVTVAAVNGVATFNDILLDTAGHYRLTASVNGLTIVSKTITILPAAAAHLSFTQASTDVVAGRQLGSRIQISATDAFGNAVANGTTITLAIDSAPTGGTIFGKLTATTHNGIAKFENVTFHTTSDYTLTATTGSVSVQLLSITVSPAVASRMIFIQAPTDTPLNTAFDVQIELLDKYGNVATDNSSAMTVTLQTHPAHALLSGSNSATLTNGLATFSGLSLDTLGTYTLRFDDDNLHLISPAFDIA
jgi:hypothetical protein